MKVARSLLLVLPALLAGCAATEPVVEPWPEPETHCASASVLLDARFPDIELMCDTVRLWDLDLRPLQLDPNGGEAGRVVQMLGPTGGYGYCGLGGTGVRCPA